MNLKPNCFEKTKVRGAFFLFFSSTNVETKNACPIAYNFENYEVVDFEREDEPEDDKWHLWKYSW